jgi:hypothetical protein
VFKTEESDSTKDLYLMCREFGWLPSEIEKESAKTINELKVLLGTDLHLRKREAEEVNRELEKLG